MDYSGYGVFARRFSSDGTALATDFQVNSFTPNAQQLATIAAGGNDRFVVAWKNDGQDGADNGVFAQRFAVLAAFDVDGDGTLGALTDGLLVLRFLFGFTGTTLTSEAVNTNGCTRCDATAIVAYLQTLI